MPDYTYTHKRYLVRNKRTGATRTVTKRIGSPRYSSRIELDEEVVACIGGYRDTTVEQLVQEDE